jgi:phospholipase C
MQSEVKCTPERLRKSALTLAVAAALAHTATAIFAAPPGGINPPPASTPPGHAKTAPLVTLQPLSSASSDAKQYLIDPSDEPNMSPVAIQNQLRKRIKYVFVIFNENHSFDNEYGTLPGVNGLYSDGQNPRAAADTPGFYQTYTDGKGTVVTVQPFRIGADQSANVVDSVDHSHTGLAAKLHVVDGVPQMDGFAQDEFTGKAGASAGNPGSANYKKGAQFANLVMSHIDCDTIPFFWRWASNFTIFDNIFATEDTPSTPNAVAMIAGQSGETQWVKHPSTTADPTATGYTGSTAGAFLQNTAGGQAGANNGGGLTSVDETKPSATTQGPPLVNDPQPFYGSPFDSTTSSAIVKRQPYGPYESYSPSNIASNLTFASVPLTLMGNAIEGTMRQDLNPGFDLPDILNDIPYIQKLNRDPVSWTWYQAGYGYEDSDVSASQSSATHWAYVSHHQGPQYFGYLANNPAVYNAGHLKGETDFFTDIAHKALPDGGVFYIRGGYINQQHLTPQYNNPNLSPADLANARAKVAAAKNGDDDHPSYSDRQISEAMAARVINAVGGDPELWSQSAIIITYDESDGFYDHVPPRILSYGPDGLPLARGVRIPLLLISPYARTHAVSHAEGDHNSVIETINAIFDLPPLASLPDEAQALTEGNTDYFNQFAPAGFEQKFLGPRDINSPSMDSLLSGFDPKRLLGTAAPLPPSMAMIPDPVVTHLPHSDNMNCSSLGIAPAAPASDKVVPAGFNALPSTLPNLN